MEDKYDKLEEAVKQVHEWLKEYGDPHTYVAVTQGKVEVLKSEAGLPLEIPD